MGESNKKPLKIVWILGGIGNQMFQYAFYRALEQHFETVKADLSGFKTYAVHNGFELERVFHVQLNCSSRFENLIMGGGGSDTIFAKIWKKMGKLFNRCSDFSIKKPLLFTPTVFEDNKSRYYYGYWQNERYFHDITDQIRKDFTFKNKLSDRNQQLQDLINSTNSVSIHVRRGDYVGSRLLGGICNVAYYRKAIASINAKIPDVTFFVFSDDITWCKDNLDIPNCHYVDWNKGENSYVDMQLMSLCKHNIIANSSFSWWGAWLNSNPEKMVIAPSKWFANGNYNINDIIPTKWEIISSC